MSSTLENEEATDAQRCKQSSRGRCVMPFLLTVKRVNDKGATTSSETHVISKLKNAHLRAAREVLGTEDIDPKDPASAAFLSLVRQLVTDSGGKVGPIGGVAVEVE